VLTPDDEYTEEHFHVIFVLSERAVVTHVK